MFQSREGEKPAAGTKYCVVKWFPIPSLSFLGNLRRGAMTGAREVEEKNKITMKRFAIPYFLFVVSREVAFD